MVPAMPSWPRVATSSNDVTAPPLVGECRITQRDRPAIDDHLEILEIGEVGALDRGGLAPLSVHPLNQR